MPLVKYNGNADLSDGTAALRLKASEDGQERVLNLNGVLELTDEEFASLRGRYQLEEVDAPAPAVEESDEEPVVVSVVEPTAVSQSMSSTPAEGN